MIRESYRRAREYVNDRSIELYVKGSTLPAIGFFEPIKTEQVIGKSEPHKPNLYIEAGIKTCFVSADIIATIGAIVMHHQYQKTNEKRFRTARNFLGPIAVLSYILTYLAFS
tara:strand:+ start:3435 stop:3770 length:336 start_codon:yes stop_codon:yes gene_type:complete